MAELNVKKILSEWLKEHAFDGLCHNFHECGCALDDLAPCAEISPECEPAYKGPDPEHEYDFRMYPSRDDVDAAKARIAMENPDG